MKFFAVFSAIVAVALASPATWSLHDLSDAIQNPNTHVSLIPILEDALNQLMADIVSGSPQTTTTVSTVVQDFSAWTLHELSEAIQNPATNPALVPYLEHALNSMMNSIMAGEPQDFVIVATPVGLLPVDQAVIPVAPVETPVVPAESVPAASPLVQIIVNVNSQQETVVPVPVPSPVEDVIPIHPQPVPVPSPVEDIIPIYPHPVPAPVVLPEPVLPEVVVPAPVVLPEPVLPEVVVPAPVVLPEPVLPEVISPNPVDIIAINPEVGVNPVDVIAITAPEVNPVDLISPLPVIPVGAVDVVGPLV